MARKATDLFEIFRHGDEDEDSGGAMSTDRRRKKSAKKKRAKAGASGASTSGRGADKGFRGLILSQRQLVLAASACCLLVVLSFVLGLSAGRPGASATPAIRKNVAAQGTWHLIRGELPRVHPATQNALDPAKVRSALETEYRVPRKNLKIRQGEGSLILEIGPFRSAQRARDYLRDQGLDMVHLYGADPFLGAEIVPFRR